MREEANLCDYPSANGTDIEMNRPLRRTDARRNRSVSTGVVGIRDSATSVSGGSYSSAPLGRRPRITTGVRMASIDPTNRPQPVQNRSGSSESSVPVQ